MGMVREGEEQVGEGTGGGGGCEGYGRRVMRSG
jgi:hypothetical protein